MRRCGMVGVLVGFGLTLAACGAAASPNTVASHGPETASPSDAGGPSGTAPGDVQSGGGWGSAVIVVGETQTEFAIPTYGCSTREDEVEGHGDAVDGSDASFSVTFPLTIKDWDSRRAHLIVVTMAGHRWVANGPSTEDLATFAGPKVDALEIAPASDDPRSFHATGSFLVVDTSGVPYRDDRLDQTAGTFDITCNPTS